jgi:hypothetical protein
MIEMTASGPGRVTPVAAAHALVVAAGLAPSVLNTQPWRFDVHGSTIDLYADTDRALLECADPLGRQLVISCGAALLNMRVTAAFLGRVLDIQLLPVTNSPTLLARATIGPRLLARSADAALYPAIRHRHTYRRPFLPRSVPGHVIGELTAAAHAENATLVVVSKEDRGWLFDLIAFSEAALVETPGYDKELRRWVGARASRNDGIPASAVGTTSIDNWPPMRDFAHADPRVVTPREHYRPDPCVAILSTSHDEPLSWLHAGQALQRVLLLGCTRGLAASFLNQPLEVADIRSELFHFGKPQMILRLGYAGRGTATPRRPLPDLIGAVRSSTRPPR